VYIKQSCIIISIGTELTTGQIQEAHLRYLAPYCKSMGFNIIRSIQIPDNLALMKSEMAKAIEDCELLFITGGLGPTSDDLTREVVAETAQQTLIFNENIWSDLIAKFQGQKIAETNKKQALIPSDFTIIPNQWGTAPGFYGNVKHCLLIVLPGPPRELKPMFESSVLRLLVEKFHYNPLEHEIACASFLISESELEAGFQKCQIAGISWQTRLESDRVLFTVKSADADKLHAFLERLESLFGKYFIRRSTKSSVEYLFAALQTQGKTIAFAESCTGGLLGKLITDIPGSSAFFKGGAIVYTNALKSSMLGVDSALIEKYGAVSIEVVSAMAQGIIESTESDFGIAVTGIAGPDGGSPEKPVGTVWIGIAGKNQEILTWKHNFTGNRERIRNKTAITAFLNAETVILAKDNT